jgi:hypothetical protein
MRSFAECGCRNKNKSTALHSQSYGEACRTLCISPSIRMGIVGLYKGKLQ